MWIVKIPTQAQGVGIYLTKDLSFLRRQYVSDRDKCNPHPAQGPLSPPQTERLVIQRYIHPPLLWNGKKFDIRVYMLVASIDPLLVYFLTGLYLFLLGLTNCLNSEQGTRACAWKIMM